ncbi:MAG: choline-sulfatase, partial [Alphaproteobacteria bacterium]|nr:choline-sulfatase [Alphaproteobacteria bacterium]
VQEAGEGVTTFQIEYDEEVAFAARRKIFQYAMEKSGPFCMVASFIHPHDPYVARPEWWNLYSDDDIDMPNIGEGELVEDDPHSKRLKKGIEADVTDCSDQEIRNARRGYYANTSYFDSKVGELVKTLEEAQLLDNTIVIVTSDHGDMLGERGLWYKMSFFEHSARVPLIMAGPGIDPSVVDSACSLVDLLPTMLDIADTDPELGMPIDGRSLWPVATGHPDTGDEAIAEYCAECASHPIYMIRRGKMKYIHCDIDPPQLYDLGNDAEERVNLADDPAYADQAAAFAREVAERWDSDAIRDNLIKTQHQRRAVHKAMQEGLMTSWDYQPVRDASNEYVRNHMDWTVAAERTRFPPFAKKYG